MPLLSSPTRLGVNEVGLCEGALRAGLAGVSAHGTFAPAFAPCSLLPVLSSSCPDVTLALTLGQGAGLWLCLAQ